MKIFPWIKSLKIFCKRYWLFLVPVVPLLLILYIRYIEPNRLVVKKCELPVANWPKSRDGLRVALLSDLHFHPGSEGWQKRIVKAVMSEKPDMIMFLGDYVLSHRGVKGNLTPAQFAAFFRKFTAPLGVFAVYGNHDIWYGHKRLLRCFAAGKIQLLNGRSVDFGDFVLYGVPDYRTGRAFTWGEVADKPGLLMCHNPTSIFSAPKRIELAVAGHLHGGQVRWPWNAPIRKSRGVWFEPGLNHVNKRRLFLTSGIGGSRFQQRWNCPPEVVILTLRSIPVPPNEIAYQVKLHGGKL